MTDTLLINVGCSGVATVTLNRPDRGNAFNQMMLDELGRCLLELKEHAGVRVLILRANGKHFCTGADVTSRSEGPPAAVTLNEVLSRLNRCPKATVAVVQGACVGGG